MPGITWDAEADRKILIEILKDPDCSTNIDWDGLAARLSTDTISCTVGGLKKHISRMKIAARDDNGDGSDSPAPNTPAAKKGKTKATGTAGSSAGPKSKGKGKAALKRKTSDDSDDDDEEGTPLTKKLQKAAVGQGELKVKTEDNDDED